MSFQVEICNYGTVLEMSDFVISYRPQPTCVVAIDVLYVDRTNRWWIEPREETEHRQIGTRLVQWMKPEETIRGLRNRKHAGRRDPSCIRQDVCMYWVRRLFGSRA